MMRNGIAYRLHPLAPLISETECLLWPTPRTQMVRKVKVRDGGHRCNLEEVVAEAAVGLRILPPPLPMAALGAWRQNIPSEGRGSKSSETMPLQDESRTDFGQLNPTWVEWLMGFPLGWTDLEGSETPSSPKSQNGSDGES